MRTVILTGAGISAESGIDTFRDPDGVWARYEPAKLATPEGFAEDPKLVHSFYNARRAQLGSVSPNAAHMALVELERALGDDFLLVTQNVDNLHERAGSQRLLHMHGRLSSARCGSCDGTFEWMADITVATACPACSVVGEMRPDIVWFGEYPHYMDEIVSALDQCERFIAIGTSGAVYPASGFVTIAANAGAHTLELNLKASEGTHRFDSFRHGPATEIVPAFVAETIAADASPS
ncbi:NAD-dependent deacylase [Oricola sp.]|uniref:NAD-dependent deacylase n=1 Tax=Oricola sp. TaxID=1979950 RepID=UPI003BAB60DD